MAAGSKGQGLVTGLWVATVGLALVIGFQVGRLVPLPPATSSGPPRPGVVERVDRGGSIPVTPRPAAPPRPVVESPPPSPTVERPGRGWAVQVLASRDEGAVRRHQAELRSRGFPAFITPHTSGGTTQFRLRLGPYASRAAAEEVTGRLGELGYEHYWLVPPR